MYLRASLSIYLLFAIIMMDVSELHVSTALFKLGPLPHQSSSAPFQE